MEAIFGWNNPAKVYTKTDTAADTTRTHLFGAVPAFVATVGWGIHKSMEFGQDAVVNMLANNCSDANDAKPWLRVCDDRYAPNSLTGMHGEDSHGYGVTLAIVGATILALSTTYILAHRLIGSGEKGYVAM